MTPDPFDVVLCLASAFLAGFAVSQWLADRRYGKELRRMRVDLVALRCRAEVNELVRRDMAQHEARR